MTPQSVLADAVLNSRTLLARYLKGFTDENRTRQAPNLPNHVAWCLGHLALTLHRVAEKFDGRPLPPADFTTGGAGGEERGGAGVPPAAFNPESVAFASTPIDDPTAYPTLVRSTAIFDAACERLAAAVRAAPEAKLNESTKWGAGETTLGALAARMVFHNGVHTGQIADLRRALGFKSIFG